jgi:ribosomal protein S18 acetylase RimI-like enzyme
MQIRPLKLSDEDAARRLWVAVDHVGPVPRHEIEAKLRRDPELFLVAVDGDELVGAVMGSYDGRRGWIARLAVAPDRQGEGIAAALVSRVEQQMCQLGVRRVNLLVIAENSAGRAFWEARGYAPAEPVVLQSKLLAPEPTDELSGSC